MKTIISFLIAFVMLFGCSNDITGIHQNETSETQHRIYDKVQPFRLEEKLIPPMATSKQNPGTVSVGGSGETLSNPNNIKLSDNLRSTINMYQIGLYSQDVLVYNFGHNIPTGATINSIKIVFEVRAIPATENTIELYMKPLISLSESGTGYSDYTPWGATDQTISVSKTPTQWGIPAVTPAQINNSGFGFTFFVDSRNNSNFLAEIDNVYTEVDYTDSGTTISETQSLEISISGENDESTGAKVSESQNLELGLGLSQSEILDIVETQNLDMQIFGITKSNLETATVRLISDTFDLTIDQYEMFSNVETWSRKRQINDYEDGHKSLYFLGSTKKKFNLTFHANYTNLQVVKTLRAEIGTILFFPQYNLDLTTFYRVKVDNRIPVYYAGGSGDKSRMFQVVLYEVA